MIVYCADFRPLTLCCKECTEKTKTVVYPTNFDGLPDLGMGIRGLMCCYHIHVAQKAPRLWWYEKYLRGSARFTEQEIQLALQSNRENYHRIFGEIHQAARSREERQFTKKAPVKQIAKKSSSCPECGSNWNGIVCENCGSVG